MKQPTEFPVLLKHLGFLVLAVFLFALPHPTDLFLPGLPFLSFFSVIPVFFIVAEVTYPFVWVYGFLYGVAGYGVYVSWLATFNPAAMPVISLMYGAYLAVTFLLMKCAGDLFPEFRFYAQWVVWCTYEFVKTLGFAGFSYGVTAYSFWQTPILIQCVDLIGVFGLSALVTFFSAIAASILQDGVKNWKTGIKKQLIPGIIWVVLLGSCIVYGIAAPKEYSDADTVTVALIQTDSDPWVGGFSSYERDLETLMRLSDEALSENPDIKYVVWPETSFIPRITWHYQRREERDKFELVEKLLNYINSKNSRFIIGNDDGKMGYTVDGKYGQVDYNAVMVFTPGQNVIPPEAETYHKIHLVPFTEWFPYKKQLPIVYKMLEENDTHFWDPGNDPKVFRHGDFSFSTPVCFEDTFGSMGRLFVRNGAHAFINLSNDAWANSEACQRQHLAMAVFRSVENRVPTVRSTASGQTVYIDPNGVIKLQAEPFCQTYLIADVPLVGGEKQTIYTRYGDWTGVLMVILFVALFCIGVIEKLIVLNRKRKEIHG